MQHEPAIAIITVALLGYALAAEWIERSPLSGPMLFTALGIALSPLGAGLIGDLDRGWIVPVATTTLVIVLFRDAANIRFAMAGSGRQASAIAARLLLIGIPLTIAAGTLAGAGVLGFALIDAVILAVVLTPTDAALAQPVISNPSVPEVPREAVKAESGLNDGLCLPLLLIALQFAAMRGMGGVEHFRMFFVQVLFGPVVGAGVGIVGGTLARRAFDLKIARPVGRTPAMVLLAALAYVGAEYMGGNGFLAAFVAGIFFAICLGQERTEEASGFALTEGTILTNLTFVIFGALFVPAALAAPVIPNLVYAALSLTVVRMLPVFISLAGTPITTPGKLVIGWFGPRGIASILYLLVVATEADYHPMVDIQNVAVWTILLSVLLHGVTAPFAGRAWSPARVD
jgi:NhaP-type Na+/H+ or K+/H+ antiporter